MPEGNQALSTYALVALSDWQVLAGFITRYGTAQQRPTETLDAEASHSPTLLSSSSIQEALQGPFSAFLKQNIANYSYIGRIRSKCITSQQDFFKQENHADDKADVNGLTAEMLRHFSLTSLDGLQKQLDTLVTEQHQQWIDALNYWKNGLAQYFNQSNMPLSEIETQEFMSDLTATELMAEFTELKIEPPKIKNGCTTFGAYLKLKSALAVYDSLSRRLQSHTKDDVDQFLKPLLNYFSDVEKYEHQMLESQQTQAMQVLQSIGFALPT